MRTFLLYGAGILVLNGLLAWSLATFAPHAKAAEPAAPTNVSDNCELVATVGLLETYLCQLPDGDVYINSFGFMVPVE